MKTRIDWVESAACKGLATTEGYSLFYDQEREREAKAICSECPVRLDCLREALQNGVWDGIYGGMTPTERTSHYRRWRYWCKRRDVAMTREALEMWNEQAVG